MTKHLVKTVVGVHWVGVGGGILCIGRGLVRSELWKGERASPSLPAELPSP